MKCSLSILIISLLLFSFSCKQNSSSEKQAVLNNVVYDGPIIDMHLHAYDDTPILGQTHPPTLRNQTFEGAETAEALKQQVLERFQKYHIVKAVVADGEHWLADAPDQILVASANHPIDSLQKRFDEGHLKAIAEMAPFYGNIRADHPSQLPYFELAEKLGIPVGFHVLPGGPNYGFHIMPQMLGGMRAYNAEPMQLEDVLVKFPNLKLYIMHGGWPYVEDVKALLYAHPNVYVDIAVLNWILLKEECYNYLKSLMDAGFGNRIMYGTDQMVWPQTMDVGIETINSAEFLSYEQKEDIFYDNAATFLGFTESEIQAHKNP